MEISASLERTSSDGNKSLVYIKVNYRFAVLKSMISNG